MTGKNFILADTLGYEPLFDGAKRQIMGYDQTLMVTKVCFDQGADTGLHSHDSHAQSTYIASGVFMVTIGQDSCRMKAGDGFFVPKGVSHSTLCVESGILIDTFSPARLELI